MIKATLLLEYQWTKRIFNFTFLHLFSGTAQSLSSPEICWYLYLCVFPNGISLLWYACRARPMQTRVVGGMRAQR